MWKDRLGKHFNAMDAPSVAGSPKNKVQQVE